MGKTYHHYLIFSVFLIIAGKKTMHTKQLSSPSMSTPPIPKQDPGDTKPIAQDANKQKQKVKPLCSNDYGSVSGG